MSKRRPKTKLKRGQLFVRFEFWELETEAFQHLSADATRVYLFMHQRYNGSNNGAVVFSHRDASQVLRSAWRRGSNALAELMHYGFIRCRNAGEPGPNIRLASEWQMTKFECGGQPSSKNFARWDGTAFEPPYTRSEKQTPIGTVKTPRRHGEDASRPNGPDSDPESAQTVGTVKTPPPPRRRHGEDTCRYTTQGYPENSSVSQRAAPPSAGLCTPKASPSVVAERPEWRAPRMVEIPRGPGPSRFGDWVRAEGIRRGVPADYLAEALGVSVSQLARMNAGRVQWSTSQCRRAEAALVKHELGMPPRTSANGSGR